MLFAQRIKIAREEKGLLQKQLASALDIDVPMYCRIERGDRQAKREQVIQLSRIFNIEQDELLSLWIADKINSIIDGERDIATKALNIINKTL
jgi:transcriptional regulator with XRE-family HTH domain